MKTLLRRFFSIAFLCPVVTLLTVGSATLSSAQTPEKVAARDVGVLPPDEMMPGAGPVQRAPWFDKLWRERRIQWQNSLEQDTGAVVFLGDSITQGWSTLAGDFPEVKIANRGISGDTTRGVRYRLKEDVLDVKPAAVVMLIGTNDLGLDGSPEDAAANLKAIFAALKRSNPKMPVIVCKVMPSHESKSRPADKIQRLNALVDEAIQGDAQFIRVDTWSIFADADGNSKPEEFPDLLHPNAEGYAKWAAALKPVFARLKLARP